VFVPQTKQIGYRVANFYEFAHNGIFLGKAQFFLLATQIMYRCVQFFSQNNVVTEIFSPKAEKYCLMLELTLL